MKKTAFTLVELLVVIAIIAVLMSILMPALSRVRRQAKTSACLVNLRQWGLFFQMYAEEYDNHFMQGNQGLAGGGGNRWVKAMGDYHKWESDFACCPEATKPWYDENGNDNNLAGTFLGSTTAWGFYGPGTGRDRSGWKKPFKGSYGINGWVNNPDPGESHSGKPEKWHWRTPDVRGAAYVPLFVGAQRYNLWPEEGDRPLNYDGEYWSGNDHMARVCLNRHDGFINNLFMDYSARKVGLKELWTLKWHRNYEKIKPSPWTKAGGAVTRTWPEWLWPFKAY